MISLRNQLKKIGHPPGTPAHYKGFYYWPTSLRKAMKAMDAPKKHKFGTEGGGTLDKSWTEEIQGVAWDGAHWIFSSNGSDPSSPFGTMPKALYTFDGKTDFDTPKHTFIIATRTNFNAVTEFKPQIPGPTNDLFWINHIGPVVYNPNNSTLYVEHWNGSGGQLIAFSNNNGVLSFKHWITLESVEGSRVGLVGFDFDNGIIYTCHGGENISRLFIHKLDPDGKHASFTNRIMDLQPGISDGCPIQGGFFSPNGHLYITSGKGGIKSKLQYIYCYSALNGVQLSKIDVVAEENGPSPFPKQELEGICYAPITRNGMQVQLHAVLLENIAGAKDNIFLKSFYASEPDLI